MTGRQERRDRQPLLMRVDLEDFVVEQTGLLLEVSDRAVDREFGLESAERVPTVQATVGVNGKGKQVVHGQSPVVKRNDA